MSNRFINMDNVPMKEDQANSIITNHYMIFMIQVPNVSPGAKYIEQQLEGSRESWGSHSCLNSFGCCWSHLSSRNSLDSSNLRRCGPTLMGMNVQSSDLALSFQTRSPGLADRATILKYVWWSSECCEFQLGSWTLSLASSLSMGSGAWQGVNMSQPSPVNHGKPKLLRLLLSDFSTFNIL